MSTAKVWGEWETEQVEVAHCDNCEGDHLSTFYDDCRSIWGQLYDADVFPEIKPRYVDQHGDHWITGACIKAYEHFIDTGELSDIWQDRYPLFPA